MEIIWKGWIIVETKKDRYFYQINIKRLSYCIIECCNSNLDNPMFYLSYYHKWYGLGDKKNIVVSRKIINNIIIKNSVEIIFSYFDSNTLDYTDLKSVHMVFLSNLVIINIIKQIKSLY